MKDFENIGKRMPYTEDRNYVSNLISQAAEAALQQQSKAKTVSLKYKWMATAAAVLVLLAGAGVTYHLQTSEAVQPVVAESMPSPVDDFLDSLSDEDVQLLAYYEIEEIPEEAYQ